ncbi:MAG TPA: hypothetical protein VGI82_07075 [Chitinophagaceae bacterium]
MSGRLIFLSSSLQSIQYELLGANAHLNGGLWQVLTPSFSGEEMKTSKAEFVVFKKSLNQTYDLVYFEAVTQNKRAHGIKNCEWAFRDGSEIIIYTNGENDK